MRFPKSPRADLGVCLSVSPAYESMAQGCIRSIQESNPGIPIHCDEALDGISSRHSKLSVWEWSPFRRTLFLDCDTRVHGNLEPLFEELERSDLCLSREQFYSQYDYAVQAWNLRNLLLQRSKIPLDLMKEGSSFIIPDYWYNTGVLAFSEPARLFLRFWYMVWCLEGEKIMDQIALFVALRVSGKCVKELDDRYNSLILEPCGEEELLRRRSREGITHFAGDSAKKLLGIWDRLT